MKKIKKNIKIMKENKKEIDVIKKNSYYETKMSFKDDIDKNIPKDTIKMVTNGYMGTVFQDINPNLGVNPKDILNFTPGDKYLIGEYLNIPLEIDPHMKFNDNRILFEGVDGTITEIVVNDTDGLLI